MITHQKKKKKWIVLSVLAVANGEKNRVKIKSKQSAFIHRVCH